MQTHDAAQLKREPTEIPRKLLTFEKLASAVIRSIAKDLLQLNDVAACYERAQELQVRIDERVKRRVKSTTQFQANLVHATARTIQELGGLQFVRDLDCALGRVLSLRTRWRRLQEFVQTPAVDVKPAVVRALRAVLDSDRETVQQLARVVLEHWEQPSTPPDF